MPEEATMRRAILAPSAQRDLLEALQWSRERFGAAASERYGLLMLQAFRDLAEDPERVGSQLPAELAAIRVRSYHLALSRKRVGVVRVKAPRHVIFYRVVEKRVEIVRILHDRREVARQMRDLKRHLLDPNEES